MDDLVVYIVIFGVFALLAMLLAKTNKTKKLRITYSEPDATGMLKTIDVVRKWNDGWDDSKDLKCYHVGKKRIWLSSHWVIRIEEVEEEDLGKS